MEKATGKMVDHILHAYKNRIEEYVTYMEELYIKGTLLMLDITDEIENENLEHARRLGIGAEEGEEIYYKFLEIHRIEEKSDLLYALLLSYGQTGILNSGEIKKEAPDMGDFWEQEYVRFADAVEELYQLQVSLYEKAGGILQANDREKLYEKGVALGFYNRDYIAVVIKGNKIRLGK